MSGCIISVTRKNRRLSLVILFLMILVISCSSDSPSDPEHENIPFGNFSLIAPENGSTIAFLQPTFSWNQPYNPSEMGITYELLLDKNNPPSTIITTGIEELKYTVEQNFERGETYYWQIIAKRGSDEKIKSNEVFSFTFTEGSGVIANKDLGMPLRYRHSLELFNGKLWMFAGSSGGHAQSDIWYSEDAVEWEEAVDITIFPRRFTHTSLVYDNKMWILGGTVVGRFFDDVWSTEDGSNWKEVTNDALFGLRFDHSSVVFDNKMWVIGGHVIHQNLESEETVNDVWYSIDGENWTQATEDAGFEPRSGHESVVFDNKIWVIGGYLWNEETGFSSTTNDVWYSENGIDWTIATEEIGIGNISSYESVVYDGKIWIIGGTPEGGGASGDIWYSSDGANWSKTTPFFGRVGHAVTVFKNKIWGVGGATQDSDPSDINDSWYLQVP